MRVERIINDTNDEFPIGIRVLAVDDDPTCLLLLETLLRRCKYNVTTTNQAITALKLLRQNKFDLVISDVHMPDMDGFKLLELVGLEMDLPVIMLSANGDTNVVMKGITHGACDYLLKPVRIEELNNIWQHVVRRKRFERKDRYNSDRQDKLRADSGEAVGMGSIGNNGKLKKKRKDQDEDEERDENGHHNNEDPSFRKKSRVVWSAELHSKFVAAVNQLGMKNATPKKILELMNVQKLTTQNVGSHLQKFRLYLKRISCAANQEVNIAATVRMRSPNGLGNFHTLAGSNQLHNAAFRSFPPRGVLRRLNTHAGLLIRDLPSPGTIRSGHGQSSVNSGNDQCKLQSFVSGIHNANILQGLPMSLELDQIQTNNGVSHIGELQIADSTTVFPVSSSLIDATITGFSGNPLLSVTSNSLMLEASSQQAGNSRDIVPAIGFRNGNTLSDLAPIAPASNRESNADLQREPIPINCNARELITSAPQEWNSPYQSNVTPCSMNSSIPVSGTMVQFGLCLDQNNSMDSDSIGPSSFIDNSAMEQSIIDKEGYLMLEIWGQGSHIPYNIGLLEDLWELQ
ncbi:two-component response regulator ARR12 [Gossypium hirsutum]|uniref:Two-component response regulator n=1 Tax=Gossypium hirsutum TaxID=3635 RepID=A0A1U8PAC8_GOSHI|nr:two-component response regulator ARR12-like [Gossypium hirsutum]